MDRGAWRVQSMGSQESDTTEWLSTHGTHRVRLPSQGAAVGIPSQLPSCPALSFTLLLAAMSGADVWGYTEVSLSSWLGEAGWIDMQVQESQKPPLGPLDTGGTHGDILLTLVQEAVLRPRWGLCGQCGYGPQEKVSIQ